MEFGAKAVTTASAAAWRTKNSTAGNEGTGQPVLDCGLELNTAEGRSKGGTF